VQNFCKLPIWHFICSITWIDSTFVKCFLLWSTGVDVGSCSCNKLTSHSSAASMMEESRVDAKAVKNDVAVLLSPFFLAGHCCNLCYHCHPLQSPTFGWLSDFSYLNDIRTMTSIEELWLEYERILTYFIVKQLGGLTAFYLKQDIFLSKSEILTSAKLESLNKRNQGPVPATGPWFF